MYTSDMQKASGATRWWDWTAIVILFIMVETSASRLVATNWTEFLHLGQTAAYLGFIVGTSLGYSRFPTRLSRWLSLLYMGMLLPLQWTLVIDQKASLEEQFMSVGGRLFFSYSDLLGGRAVEDPIFFITLITLGFWIIGASAGFQLMRRQNYLAAVVPAGIVLMVIQSYDNIQAGRIWIIALYAFLALLLLGRLNYLANRKSWSERRIFLSPDNNVDLGGILTVAAGLIILISWTPPASISGLDSAIQAWNRFTEPWRRFSERMENAISALESPSGGVRGEFYSSEIPLGRGFPLSDMVMFRVQAPDLPSNQKPPRYYWRGFTYDYFDGDQWFTTGASLSDYSPAEAVSIPLPPEASDPSRFIFQTGELTLSLVYAPAEPVWFSRQGSTRTSPADGRREVVSWYAAPSLQAGETYQMNAVLRNPNTRQLREAGQDYPAWVVDKYLQVPANFSPRIIELAAELTAAYDNPYDKSVAITNYLRDGNNIQYTESLPAVPRNRDPLEWMLFENKQAYCVYYASAQVMMLRSQGIPARLAVGFAQGERIEDERNGELFVVRKLDAHAWPEVYFPGIGWIEFEPTGGQPSLSRPFPPRDAEDLGTPIRNLPELLEDGESLQEQRALQDEENLSRSSQAETSSISTSLYLLSLFVILAALTIYFGRRYAVPQRLPVLLRATYERSGSQPPNWVVNWERWVTISPIERAFESVNFSLRLLGDPMPPDATPAERAKGLIQLLPRAEREIGALLDEHQTSLYTSREADALRARRAALRIRWQALRERIRNALEGKPIESP